MNDPTGLLDDFLFQWAVENGKHDLWMSYKHSEKQSLREKSYEQLLVEYVKSKKKKGKLNNGAI